MLRGGEEQARVSMYRRGYGDFKAGWLARDMIPLGLLLTLNKGMTL
jgi:hypothetical protein